MKIRFVFHKPKCERGIGKAIVAWTWFLGLFYNWRVLKYNYSHVEVWLPDAKGHFQEVASCDGNFPFFGQCFSSTTRGTANGVRIALASDVLHNPYRWDYIEVIVDPERCEVALAESQKLIGLRYDFWGIFGFLNPFPVQDDKRWYCSELCNWFAALCGITNREKRISPRRLAYKLAKRWGEPVPYYPVCVTKIHFCEKKA